MSYIPPFSITSRILDLVSLISEIIGKLEVLAPTAITPKLRKANKIKTITGTLAIEGNTLGIEKVTAILEGKRVMGSIREIAEVNGAIKVYDKLSTFNYKKLENLLLSHKMLMEEILTNAGSFRSYNVGVGGEDGVVHIAPPHGQVSNLMQELFEWLSVSDIHPLIKSSVFHYEFEFIHPFIDGNGRIGRLWQSLILYEWKSIFSAIPIESVIKETQEEYYNALETSESIGESTPFIEFMLEAILKACEDELKNENNVPINVPIKRLDKILSFIAENSSITIEQLAQMCKVSDKTIKRDITKLKEQGLLKRQGSLKSGSWQLLKEE
ncbi:MAG: cell filamentation protein Fic [Sulfurimonas sp.]|nr:MAG: cell filamentation protein Fic [Sulfurimonas sp.]